MEALRAAAGGVGAAVGSLEEARIGGGAGGSRVGLGALLVEAHLLASGSDASLARQRMAERAALYEEVGAQVLESELMADAILESL